MRLELRKPFKSIQNLDSGELPNFTLITGPNGSGKTHLLHAILDGHIIVHNNGKLIPSNCIRYFDASAFQRNINISITPGIPIPLRNTLIDLFTALHQENLDCENISQFSSYPISTFIFNDINSLIQTTGTSEKELKYLIDKAKNQLSYRIQQHTTQAQLRFIEKIANQLAINISEITLENLRDSLGGRMGEIDASSPNITYSFQNYRRIELRNFQEFYKRENGKDNEYLEPAEFISKYGQPPWNIFNSILSKSNINWRVKEPDLDKIDSFKPELYNIRSGISLEPDYLSSGEQVIFRIAQFIFSLRQENHLVDIPQVILLDECESGLHSNILNIFMNFLKVAVDEFGIIAIMATHSLTTVAVTPEENLFYMEAEPKRIRHREKQEALYAMGVGLPRIAISFDGRRQVFVEDPFDAAAYTHIHDVILNSHIKSERSLSFLATGANDDNGNTNNTGSSNVKRIVKDLRKSGNLSCYGIIDWDRKNENDPQNFIFVLSHKKRYSIENLIFDPYVFLLFLYNRKIDLFKSLFSSEMNPKHDISFSQNCIDKIGEIVFGHKDEMQTSTYTDGSSFSIDSRFFGTKGKDIVKLYMDNIIIKNFSEYSLGSKHTRKLMRDILNCVDTVPIDFLEIMDLILNQE